MGDIGSMVSAGSNMLGGIGSLFATGGGMASMAGSTAVMSSAYAAPAIATAAGEAAGTAAASGAMAAISTAMPYLAAAYVAYTLLTQDHGTPTANTGNAAMQFNPSGNMTGMQTFYGGTTAATNATITGMQTAYMQAAMNLGIGTVATQFRYGGNTGENGQHPNFALGGGAGGSNFYQGETGVSDAAVQLAASRAVFAALQGSQLPQYLKSVFNGLSAGAMSQAQIDSTLAYAQSLKQTRDALLETRTPLAIAQANVANLTKLLGTSAETFKTDFVAAIDAGIGAGAFMQWQNLGTAMEEVNKQMKDMTALLTTDSFATMLDYKRYLAAAGTPEASKLLGAGTFQIPSYDVGTSSVPFDMVAQIHQGERIIPAASNDELVTEIKALRAAVERQQRAAEETASNTRASESFMRRISPDGNSITVTVAA
jgi:hypothetical protein